MPKKSTYRVHNWKEYNASLVQRGSVTIWLEEEALAQWEEAKKTGKRGRPRKYSDVAIECLITLKSIYRLALRALQGFAESLKKLFQCDVPIPHYTTTCRRQKALAIVLKRYQQGESIHVVIDSTGLKIYGEGEWKVRQHGAGKRRTWRKLHLGIDADTSEVAAVVLSTNDVTDPEVLPDLLEQVEESIDQVSADGAYDTFSCHETLAKRGAKATIPPRCNARIRQHAKHPEPPLPRDEILRSIRKKGLKGWKKDSGYHRRSLAETAMYRFKQLFGGNLRARIFENQCTEAFIKCNAMNKMSSLGMPESYVVA